MLRQRGTEGEPATGQKLRYSHLLSGRRLAHVGACQIAALPSPQLRPFLGDPSATRQRDTPGSTSLRMPMPASHLTPPLLHPPISVVLPAAGAGATPRQDGRQVGGAAGAALGASVA
jgi:hypothetical protein